MLWKWVSLGCVGPFHHPKQSKALHVFSATSPTPAAIMILCKETYTLLTSQKKHKGGSMNTHKRNSATRGRDVIFCAELWNMSKASPRHKTQTRQPAAHGAHRSDTEESNNNNNNKTQPKLLAKVLCQAESTIKTAGLMYTIDR